LSDHVQQRQVGLHDVIFHGKPFFDTSVYNIHLDSLSMFITSTRAQARDANAKC